MAHLRPCVLTATWHRHEVLCLIMFNHVPVAVNTYMYLWYVIWEHTADQEQCIGYILSQIC